jgi:hypothetical protein
MSDKKSNHNGKNSSNPGNMQRKPGADQDHVQGRQSLQDPNPAFDPGDDEGNLPSKQKVPGAAGYDENNEDE